MSGDFLKRSRTSATIRAISEQLTSYADNHVIKEDELKKVLELVRDEVKLIQLLQYL